MLKPKRASEGEIFLRIFPLVRAKKRVSVKSDTPRVPPRLAGRVECISVANYREVRAEAGRERGRGDALDKWRRRTGEGAACDPLGRRRWRREAEGGRAEGGEGPAGGGRAGTYTRALARGCSSAPDEGRGARLPPLPRLAEGRPRVLGDNAPAAATRCLAANAKPPGRRQGRRRGGGGGTRPRGRRQEPPVPLPEEEALAVRSPLVLNSGNE